MSIDTSVLNVDFEVLGCSTNCKVLKVVDLSNWGPTYGNPTYIDITTPGSTIAITNIFQKNQVNVFNTNNLNLSDVTDYSHLGNVPDGIYQICVRVCLGVDAQSPPQPIYNTTCQYFLQDCLFRCQIARKLLSIDLTCQPCRTKLLEEIQEIQLYLDAAQAQIQNCNVNKASEYFQRAQVLLQRLKAPGEAEGCKNCH